MTVRKTVILAFLVAVGILLQVLESFVPVVLLVPGYKIGLANIAGLFALYAYGNREMVIVTCTRILLASLMTGTLFSVAFVLSLTGGLCSMAAMMLLKKTNLFSIFGVSVGGSAAHAAGQVLAITLVYQQYFMQLFLPVLLALSIVSGLLVALLTQIVLRRLGPQLKRRGHGG